MSPFINGRRKSNSLAPKLLANRKFINKGPAHSLQLFMSLEPSPAPTQKKISLLHPYFSKQKNLPDPLLLYIRPSVTPTIIIIIIKHFHTPFLHLSDSLASLSNLLSLRSPQPCRPDQPARFHRTGSRLCFTNRIRKRGTTETQRR